MWQWILEVARSAYNVNPSFIQIPVENTQTQGNDGEDDPTFCEVCGRSDREDRLLLCDGCDAG